MDHAAIVTTVATFGGLMVTLAVILFFGLRSGK